ncbi:MAG: hypothetical protein AB1938_29635 [Myxococcota bacterium]
MSTFRVRRLRATGRGEIASGPHQVVDPRYEALSYASRIAGAVYEVASTDLELALVEIKALLNKRELRSTDLIFVDGVWKPLIEHFDVSDEAEGARRYEDRVRLAKHVGLALAAVAIFGAFSAYLWLSGS